MWIWYGAWLGVSAALISAFGAMWASSPTAARVCLVLAGVFFVTAQIVPARAAWKWWRKRRAARADRIKATAPAIMRVVGVLRTLLNESRVNNRPPPGELVGAYRTQYRHHAERYYAEARPNLRDRGLEKAIRDVSSAGDIESLIERLLAYYNRLVR